MKTIIPILCALLLTVGAYWYIHKSQPVAEAPSTEIAVPTLPPADDLTFVATRPVPDGMREYRNRAYQFSVLYPQDLKMAQEFEAGGAMTITFQNNSTQKGFQIFVTPYNEPQVSEARFKLDLPSGVRKNLVATSIDGATGAAFYSESDTLGETREVWFIKNGVLYEVTTLKPLETWLDEILKTWKFE